MTRFDLTGLERIQGAIRGYVNDNRLYENHFMAFPLEWDALCASMDVLGDTAFAFADFLDHGIGIRDGEKYLRFYGVLQAAFMHQNAIFVLYRTLCREVPPVPNDQSWKTLRELRNTLVGHPVKDDLSRSAFVTRITMSDNWVDSIISDHANACDSLRRDNIPALITDYTVSAVRELENVFRLMRARFSELFDSELNPEQLTSERV